MEVTIAFEIRNEQKCEITEMRIDLVKTHNRANHYKLRNWNLEIK